jgi:hypothetical protein
MDNPRMSPRIRFSLVRCLFACLSLNTLRVVADQAGPTSTPPAPAATFPDARPALASALKGMEPMLARTEFQAYRGWLKFLRFEAETAVERTGSASELANNKVARLAEWISKIQVDPELLGKLRGVQEWAYESPVDGSGQPFKIVLPSDYDPNRSFALSVYMHGYSGNHIEHSTGFSSRPGIFDLAVLGRSRGGGYRALSEADVLHVIDYVEAHWPIDADRIHLNGGSMGGGGTFRLGARYPHRWASGRPTCGFASYLPMGNLLTFPIYATHSDDDPTVSILHTRGPLQLLREKGGQAILDETTGLGHAAWDYAAGNERGGAWELEQRRPSSKTIRRIDYTALDGLAMRGWWGEIVEWGPAPKPARFILTVGDRNTVFVEAINVARLRLRLSESPLDRNQPLRIVLNGTVPVVVPSPLPDVLVLRVDAAPVTVEDRPEQLPWRLHTPGSTALLYGGEPLLIVYGTQGSEAMRSAMKAGAEAASKSPNPSWLDDSGEKGGDGVPHSQNLYGRLLTKADRDVTEEDIARCHLVLIGTAEQNALVSRIASKLPVTLAGQRVSFSDGESFAAEGGAMGLVHYNPLAPSRLIFWVASEAPEAYGPNAYVPLLSAGSFFVANAFGADWWLTSATEPRVVACRTLDSRWKWTNTRAATSLVSSDSMTHRQFATAVANSVRTAAAAEFAIIQPYGDGEKPAITPGVTRVGDIAPMFFCTPIGRMTITGRELKQMDAAFQKTPGLFLVPSLSAETLMDEGEYRVALPVDVLWAFSRVTHFAPRKYELLETGVGEAVEKYFPSVGGASGVAASGSGKATASPQP